MLTSCHVKSFHSLDPGLLVIHITVELVQSIGFIQFLVAICSHVLHPRFKGKTVSSKTLHEGKEVGKSKEAGKQLRLKSIESKKYKSPPYYPNLSQL